MLQQIQELLEKAAHAGNGTGPLLGNGTGPLVEHVSLFLPKTLVLCTRERPVLCLLLMLGTLWLGYALYLIKRR